MVGKEVGKCGGGGCRNRMWWWRKLENVVEKKEIGQQCGGE